MRKHRLAVVANKDNEWKEPKWICGFVDEVNGLGAEEILDFNSTRHELSQKGVLNEIV